MRRPNVLVQMLVGPALVTLLVVTPLLVAPNCKKVDECANVACNSNCPDGDRRCTGNKVFECVRPWCCAGYAEHEDCEPQGLYCAEGACVDYQTVCSDGERSVNETSTDCGGICPPCADGLYCAQNSDCESGYCNTSYTCDATP